MLLTTLKKIIKSKQNTVDIYVDKEFIDFLNQKDQNIPLKLNFIQELNEISKQLTINFYNLF